MIVKKQNKQTKQEIYFACYDMESFDFCVWTKSKAVAANMNEECAYRLINYLYVNSKVEKHSKVEVL